MSQNLANIEELSALRPLEALAASDTLFSQPGGIGSNATDLNLANILPTDALNLLGATPPDQATSDDGTASNDQMGAASIDPAGLLEGGAGGLLTSVGQSISALGAPNGYQISQDVLHIPGEATGLNDTSGNVASILYNAGDIPQYAGTFADSTLANVGNAGDQPIATTANNLILDFHNLIELTSDALGVGSGAVHGLTNLGETVGLGHIGEDNLLTTALNVPGDLLSGGDMTGDLGHLSANLSDVSGALTGPVTGLLNDLGSQPYETGLLGPGGILGGSGLDLGKLGDVLNPDGSGSAGAVASLTDNLTHLLDPVGSSSPISSNLVSDALSLPGELLSGNGTPSLTNAGHQLNTTLIAAGDLVENALHGLGSDTSQSPNGLLQSVVADVNNLGSVAGPAIGIPQTLEGVHAATDALGLGAPQSAGPDGLVAAVAQTVNGAVSDLTHDIDQSGLSGLLSGDAIHLPVTSGTGADGLVGVPASVAQDSTPAPAAAAPEAADHGLIAGLLAPLDVHHDTGPSHGGLLGHGLGLV